MSEALYIVMALHSSRGWEQIGKPVTREVAIDEVRFRWNMMRKAYMKPVIEVARPRPEGVVIHWPKRPEPDPEAATN